jgi:hypothetical protein
MRATSSKRNGKQANWLGVLAATLLVGTLAAAAVASPGRASQTANPAAAFPLSPGTYWVYQGVVRWNPAKAPVAQERMVQWKMTVERVIRRNDLVAAVVSGFPAQLNGSQGDRKPAPALIVEQAGAKYYRIGAEAFPQALARLQDPNDSLDGLVTDDQIFLALPLARGKKFCNASGMIRTDQYYCWVTGKPEPADIRGVKGAPPGAHTAFPIQFLSGSENTMFDFVPGIGITRYTYQRHGTTADTELELVEFHPGGR